MPTPQLFGDDDDDDSDDSSVKAPTTDTPTNKKDDGDDADTNQKDDGDDAAADQETKTAVQEDEGTVQVEMKDIGDDDDDDDDDEEMKDSEDDNAKKKAPKEAKKSAFDSDSSDNDDDGDATKDNNKATKPSADIKQDDKNNNNKEEKDPFAEGSDDSDDDDDDALKKAKPDKKKDDNDNDDLLEDSDEDDVEFDDSGGITGTGHSKGFQRKKSAQSKSSLDRAREAEARAEEELQQEEAEAVPKKPRPPRVDPRTMMVSQPDVPPSSASLHITKLPNLVGIQPEAFDAATYSAAREETDFNGFVHDMIRWRYKMDPENPAEMMRDPETNQLMRESNARLVQWEDDSYTLHVGNETFIVDNIDSSQKNITASDDSGRKFQFAGLNGYLYLSQIATYRTPKEEEKKEDDEAAKADDDDDNKDKDDAADKEKEAEEKAKKVVEFDETPAGTVLECMGAMSSRFTARPLLKSEAHKSLTVAVHQKNIKRAMIAEHVTQEDPEAAKAERIKYKDGLEKEKARKRAYGDNDRGYNRRQRPAMNRSYLEEDDGDYDTTGINAMKRRTMNADDDDMMDDYGDDDSDSEEEQTFNRRPAKRSNALDDSDNDSDDPAPKAGAKTAADKDEDDDDDDDDDVIAPVKTSKKRTHQAVFDDDDSD